MSIGRRNDGNLGTYFDGLIDSGCLESGVDTSEIGSLFNTEAPVTGCTSLEACNFSRSVWMTGLAQILMLVASVGEKGLLAVPPQLQLQPDCIL